MKQRALTWQDIWSMEDRIKFLMCSVYDVLPTPSNLHTSGLVESPSCTLCVRTTNLEHVLSPCQSSLADGEFRWRHDQILMQLAEDVPTEDKGKETFLWAPLYPFGLCRRTSRPAGRRSKGVLTTAGDWEMRANLKKKLKFPEEIAHTSLRPDIVLWSKGTKQVVLTVP